MLLLVFYGACDGAVAGGIVGVAAYQVHLVRSCDINSWFHNSYLVLVHFTDGCAPSIV